MADSLGQEHTFPLDPPLPAAPEHLHTLPLSERGSGLLIMALQILKPSCLKEIKAVDL